MAKKIFRKEYIVVDVDSYEVIIGKYPGKSRAFDDTDIIIVTPKNNGNKTLKEELNLKEGEKIIVLIAKK